LRTEGSGDDLKLTVSFISHGLKKMIAKYAELENERDLVHLSGRWCARLRDFEFGVFRDHFLQAVRDEADGEFEIVARAFGAEDCAVSIFGMFDASAQCPRAGGLFLRFGFEVGCRLLFS